jgi:hypothetical protein
MCGDPDCELFYPYKADDREAIALAFQEIRMQGRVPNTGPAPHEGWITVYSCPPPAPTPVPTPLVSPSPTPPPPPTPPAPAPTTGHSFWWYLWPPNWW